MEIWVCFSKIIWEKVLKKLLQHTIKLKETKEKKGEHKRKKKADACCEIGSTHAHTLKN